jgi:Ca2+:H+ antiporter
LFLSYIIGLWFTLRTHAAVIWNAEIDEKKVQIAEHHSNISHYPIQLAPAPKSNQHSGSSGGSATRKNTIHESSMFKNVLKQSLQTAGLTEQEASRQVSSSSNAPFENSPNTSHLVPPKQSGEDGQAAADSDSQRGLRINGLSERDNNQLVRTVAEMAATAAAIAARDATQSIRKASMSHSAPHHTPRKPTPAHVDLGEAEAESMVAGGAHDAPNWSRTKSAIILLGATLLYAVLAEILVDTVDIVLESVDIDEKFLGITLFALVPNTTEFLVRGVPISARDRALTLIERYFLRYERQHRAIHGDRFRLRSTGLLTSNTGTGPL